MELTAKLVPVSTLTPALHDAMFALMDEHYANVHRRVFAADLAEKRWAILVRDAVSERLCGFSTLMLLDADVAGRPIKALFSGDTIIHRDCWGERAFARAWGRFALTLIDDHPDAELYWFLISQGYKTYRFLPLFFHEFYPRPAAPTPAVMRAIIDALAGERYGASYDAAAGIVRATPTQYRLRPGLADVTPERLRDPLVAFFHAANPGHARGDELGCLAPLTRGNFTPAAYRVIAPERMALGVS